MLVYVDDIILTSNSISFMTDCVSNLSKNISLIELKILDFFLGIEVLNNHKGLILSQQKYITDILAKIKMDSVKILATPMSSSSVLSLFDGATGLMVKNTGKKYMPYNI